MNVIFSDADLVASYRQQRNILRAYIGVCCAFALLCLGFYLYFLSLPYNDPMQLLPKVVVCAATCAFIIFSYIFMGIKYHRARKYYKLISYFSVGMKQVNVSYFSRYEQPETKDGVEYNVLIFSEWSKKKSEYMDRKVHCVTEKPLPQFRTGDKVCYLTQNNVMLEYETIGHDERFAEDAKGHSTGGAAA